MTTVGEVLDTLRGQFHRLRYARTEQDYAAIALEMGLAKATLYKFAKGGPSNEKTLLQIQTWCLTEARTQGEK